MKNKIIKYGVLNALGTVGYIVLVVSFLSHAEQFFGPEEPKGVLVPISMLSLLVFSAALTGLLIFGRPILWYWDGQKKEAIYLLTYTLLIFLITTLITFAILFLIG